MTLGQRLARHARLSVVHRLPWGPPTPPLLILFINSICNQTCEHCFYWRNLNRKDDLTLDELRSLSNNLGKLENLNLSGGEPFLRPEFAEICNQFIDTNGVKQIYVPTNGSFTGRTVAALKDVFRNRSLDLFAVELSLDGMPTFHNAFRGMNDAFERAMETYDALAEMKKSETRLHIHAVSTVTADNMAEVRSLTDYLFERCPEMEHHSIAMIRGDRKNPALTSPRLADYRNLYAYVRDLWHPREQGRYGSIVEPMLQRAKTSTAEEQRQVIPCRAGRLTGVVYSNGDVSVCESHAPLGNLRQQSFTQIWRSKEANRLRRAIEAKKCWCTNEVFLWSSIIYQPVQLAKAMLASKPWKRPASGGPGYTDEGRPELQVLQ
jgi:MoaA/NifB/PqqE/SkfB family radical SAM enzyme